MSHKQSARDRPGLQAACDSVESSKSDPWQKAAFLAVIDVAVIGCQHCQSMWSPSWRRSIRVSVTLQLGLGLCAAHTCRCGSQVDKWDLHAFVCKTAPSRITRHHALNDIISRAFASAKIPVTKEPSGLFRSDGKRPDGLTLIPWQRGLSLTWDVTVATRLLHFSLCILSWRRSWDGGVQKTSQARRIVRVVRVPADCFENCGPNQRICCAILKRFWATKSLPSLPMIRRHNLSFSELCRDLTPSCYMKKALRETQTLRARWLR